MAPSVFVGIGSGRCGTVSLARIIGACRNTHVSHENPAFRTPWERPEDAPLQTFVDHARWCRDHGLCVGDIALYWLPHIPRIRAQIPELRVISLKRDRAATVASLERKCPGYTLLRPGDRPHQPEWWDLMPTIDAPTIGEAWERYYDAYYAQVAELDDVLDVATEDLDDDGTLTRIFDYLAIPDADRAYIENRHHNTAASTVVTSSRLRDG